MTYLLLAVVGTQSARRLLIECVTDPNTASVTLAKLQNPVKQSFEAINSDLKDVYKGLGNYGKAIDKVQS